MADQAYVANHAAAELARARKERYEAAAAAERARVLQREKEEAEKIERAHALQNEKDEAAEAERARIQKENDKVAKEKWARAVQKEKDEAEEANRARTLQKEEVEAADAERARAFQKEKDDAAEAERARTQIENDKIAKAKWARALQKEKDEAEEANRARALQKKKDEAAEAERARALQKEKDGAAAAEMARTQIENDKIAKEKWARALQKEKDEAAEAERARAIQKEKDDAAAAEMARAQIENDKIAKKKWARALKKEKDEAAEAERARALQKEKDDATEAERARTQKENDKVAKAKWVCALQKEKDEAAEVERACALQKKKDDAAEAERARKQKENDKAAKAKWARALQKEKDEAEEANRAHALQKEKDEAAQMERAHAAYQQRIYNAWHPQEEPTTSANGSYDTDSEEDEEDLQQQQRNYEAFAIQRQQNETLVDIDLSPYLKVYKNGRVQKLLGSPRVNPSETKAQSGIFSKDVRISENVRARVYCSANVLGLPSPKKLPILVYYHGGGFCCEAAVTAKTHRYVIQLASKANAVVVSVDYRVAPQHPLPAAFEDALEALKWVALHAPLQQSSGDSGGLRQKATDILGTGISYAAKIAGAVPAQQGARVDPVIPWLVDHGDFSRLFVGGDGAGGTLAHYVSLQFGKKMSEGNNIPLANGVKILGTILCFPYFLEKTTKEESLAYRLWTYLYPKGANSPYINPFGTRYSPFEFQKMFVCHGYQTDVCVNFVKAMESVDKMKGKVTVIKVEGRDSFQVKEPTTSHAQKLISDIAFFIQC